MAVEILLTDRQAEPRALAALGGIEGLKHIGSGGAIHAHTANTDSESDLQGVPSVSESVKQSLCQPLLLLASDCGKNARLSHTS
jgi:hypothetical protein